MRSPFLTALVHPLNLAMLGLRIARADARSYHLEQDIRNAEVRGSFRTYEGEGISLRAWVPAVENLLIVELTADGEKFTNMETGARFAGVKDRISSANVYLGAEPVVAALDAGCLADGIDRDLHKRHPQQRVASLDQDSLLLFAALALGALKLLTIDQFSHEAFLRGRLGDFRSGTLTFLDLAGHDRHGPVLGNTDAGGNGQGLSAAATASLPAGCLCCGSILTNS